VRLAVLAPILLLVAIVGVAAAPRFAPPAATDASAVPAANAARLTAPAASGGTSSGIEAVAPWNRTVDRSVPSHAWDLPVRSLRGLLFEREAGFIKGGLVAVVAYLSYDPREARCPVADPGRQVVFCQRTARLGAAAGGPWLLDLAIPPGIPIPSMFATNALQGAPGGEALLSVVIGRFAPVDLRTCPTPALRFSEGHAAECHDSFLLERLAWASGSWVDRILVRDPAVLPSAVPSTGRRPEAIAVREADRMERILSMAVVEAGWLEAVDPTIGRAVAQFATTHGIAPGPVWYVRSVGRQVADLDRALNWLVLDHGTGLVLSSGAIDPG
jgi:hypothetical protein